jgi:signal transduction histidine kinase
LYAQKSEIIALQNEYDLLKIGKQTSILKDESGSLTIADILKQEHQQKFQPNDYEVFTASASADVYWVKFTFENQSQYPAWLAIETNYISYIDFYAPDSLGNYGKAILTGKMREVQSKQYDTDNYWLPLSLANTPPQTYYVCFRSIGVVEIPSYVGSLIALQKEKAKYDFLAASFIGAMLLMFFYNFLLYLITKEKLYLIYLLYLPFALMTGLLLNGRALFEEWIPSYYWHRYLLIIHAPLYIFISWFVIAYLDMKNKLPKIYKGIILLVSLLVLSSIIASIVPDKYYYLAYNTFQIFVALSSIVSLATIVYLSFKKQLSTAFFMAGWFSLFLCGIIYLLTINHLIDYNIFSRNILYLGFSMEVCLFSLALGYRFNALREKNRIIEEQNFELDQVNETLKINTEKLQEANQSKDRLFSIIAHDLRSPIYALHSVLNVMEESSLSEEEMRIFFLQMTSDLKNATNLLDSLLLWSRSQLHQITANPEIIDLRLMIINKINLLKTQAQEKEIQVENQVNTPLSVIFDKNMIGIVLQNLLSNAIKFTKQGGKVTIEAMAMQDQIQVSIADTGIGLSKERAEKIFTMQTNTSTTGTAGEKGSGLGLLICKDFVEKNGGKIWVESEEGKGSAFKFMFPALLQA